MTIDVKALDAPVVKPTSPMAADATKRADSTDRLNRSLVKDMPLGAPKPANKR